jgi:hypothetical protein
LDSSNSSSAPSKADCFPVPSSMKISLLIGTRLLDGRCQGMQGGAIRCPSRREFTAPPCARFPSFRARSKGWACTA